MMPITKVTYDEPVVPETDMDDDLIRLELAASVSDPTDVSTFVEVYQTINWRNHSADAYMRAIRMALWVGAHLIAQELAIAGEARYPEHRELQNLAALLAPPKVSVSNRLPDPANQGNMAWLKKHWHEYKSKWVALRSGQLLAVADTLDGLEQQIGEVKNSGIMVTPVW